MLIKTSEHTDRKNIRSSRSQRHRESWSKRHRIIMVATTSEDHGRNDIGSSWSQ
ncbi:hypothetical protein DPMN_083302 [Dreissena polymorpha]|uniref:Uncharacterized protein n=1 Tax=Dreissena polymorpha TaxID=45954 RepID=A0A9D4BIB1_DREPO|nr:hypothetical protein DPMN_083302 [Dreissena polymorpha]